MPSALADIVRRVHDDYCSTLVSGFNNDIFITFKFYKGLLLLVAEIGEGLLGLCCHNRCSYHFNEAI